MRPHGSTVFRGALNSTAPALCMAVAGAESRDGRAVEGNGLSVVAAVVVELVYITLLGALIDDVLWGV